MTSLKIIIALIIFVIGIVEILRLLLQSVLRHRDIHQKQIQFWQSRNTDWKEE